MGAVTTAGEKKQTIGPKSWAECREKMVGIEPKRSTFILTFPLIGLQILAVERMSVIGSNLTRDKIELKLRGIFCRGKRNLLVRDINPRPQDSCEFLPI